MSAEASTPPHSKKTALLHSDAIRTAKYLGWPILVLFIVVANGIYPVLRFTDARANVLVGTMVWLMPFMTAIYAWYIPRRWLTRIVVIVLMLPLMLASALFLLVDGLNLVDTFYRGFDPSFEPLAHVPMGGYSVGIYLTDCGVVCSFGIYLEQEKRILPGIMLVRGLPGFEPAVLPTYQAIGKNILRVDVPQYGAGQEITPGRSLVYYMRPYLYWGRRPTRSKIAAEHADPPVLLLEGRSLTMPDWECSHAVQKALDNDRVVPGTDAQCAALMGQALAWQRAPRSP